MACGGEGECVGMKGWALTYNHGWDQEARMKCCGEKEARSEGEMGAGSEGKVAAKAKEMMLVMISSTTQENLGNIDHLYSRKK